jgi:hypothetical protein
MIAEAPISIGRTSSLVIDMVDASMQSLALSGGRFYSMGMSSPILQSW